MMLQVVLSSEAEERLRRMAERANLPAEAFAASLLERELRAPTLDEVLAPVRREFAESGMTEDELGDLLERAKHEIREERQRLAS